MFNRPIFKQMQSIVAEAAASPTSNVATLTTNVGGLSCRVQCTTGIVYVSTLSTAPTSTNAWRLEETEYLDLLIPANGALATVSTSTTALRQIVVFDD